MAPSSNSVDAAAGASPRHSSAARLWGAIVSPVQTFEEIAGDPHFILCLSLQAAVAAVLWFFMLHRVGAVPMVQQAMAQSGRAQGMDPATLQRAVAVTARLYQYMPAGIALGVLLGTLVMSWIVQGVANALLGRNARFKQALAVTSHAFLPELVRSLVAALVLALMADPSRFNYLNPLGDNLGFYLSRAAVGPFLFALAGHLSLFSLWVLILLAIGIARLDLRKKGIAGPFWALFSLWLFYILAASALAGVSG